MLQLDGDVGVPTAPHLSCVGDSKDELHSLLSQYKNSGIKRIVALRGDLPSGMGMASGELRYANELVEFIRARPVITSTSKWRPTRKYTRRRSYEDDLQNFVRKARPAPTAPSPSISSAPTAISTSSSACGNRAWISRSSPASCRSPTTATGAFLRRLRRRDSALIRRQLEAYGDDPEASRPRRAGGERNVRAPVIRAAPGPAPYPRIRPMPATSEQPQAAR